VAPSIHYPQCQEVLIRATDDLSGRLQTYSSTWESLPADTHELRDETGRLKEMLQKMRTDLETGKFVKRREVERVVVTDTPLRQLACSVLEDAKV
jgi:hypothetical protein